MAQQTFYRDAVVRELIAAHGLWTGEPATNFVTSAVLENKVDALIPAVQTYLHTRLAELPCTPVR